jgi:O-antigen ligase
VLLAAMSIFFVIQYWRRGMALSVLVSIGLGLAAAVLSMITQEAGYPIIGLAAVIVVVAASYAMQMLIESVKDKRLLAGGAIAAIAAGLLTALLSLAFSDRVQNIITSRFGSEMNYESLFGHRLDVYRGALDAFRAKPVGGSGLGTFADFYQDYAITTDPTIFAHNVVIQMAADTGLVGVILFSLFLIYTVALAVKRFIGGSSPLMRSLAASVAVFVLYSMFDWEWYIPVLAAWFMVIVALMEFGDSFPEPATGGIEAGSIKVMAKTASGSKRRRSSKKTKGGGTGK